jgi:hypothetical protein
MMGDAGGSTFAAIMPGFAVFLARRDPSRRRADDGVSAFVAIVGIVSTVAEAVLNDTGFGSIG